MLRGARWLTGALLLTVLWAGAAVAQERTALTKSGVTRLLTGTTYSPPEVAGIIRRACLTFEPTPRDLEDFREMGADDQIIRAISTCAEERERASEAAALPDSVDLPRRVITASAGDTVTVVVRVRSDNIPQPGVRLMLEGTQEIPDGAGRPLTAITDSAGRAIFRVPAGTEVGRYSLRVVGSEAELRGNSLVSLAVRAAGPFRARVTPDPLTLEAGEETVVVVRIRDRFGNPIRDAGVTFRSRGPAEDGERWKGTTDRTGETRIEVAADELTSSEPLGVLVEGELLAVLPVRRPAAAPDRPGGAEREGEAGFDEGRAGADEERAAGGDPEETDGSEGRQAPGRPPLMELSLWGGHTFDNNRDPQPQTGEVAIWPVPTVRLWGRYDDALNIEHPVLVRGEIDYQSFYVGTRVEWGESDRLHTLAEFGRRVQPLQDILQTTYRLEQEILLGSGDRPEFERFSLEVGGILGHWGDRDDYLVSFGSGIPITPVFRLEPSFHVGETVGTVIASQRIPAREARLMLRGSVRPGEGWELDASLASGNVDSEVERLSGRLFDATLQVAAPVGRRVDLRLFSRYQAPPGMDSFLEVGLGVTTEIPD